MSGEKSEEVAFRYVDKDRLSRALQDTSDQLQTAAYLHHVGQHRDGMRWSLLTVITMLRNLGFEYQEIEPLSHLQTALADLDAGKTHPSLEALKVQNARGKTTSEWSARAALAGALEARVASGERREVAAAQISSRFDVLGDGSKHHKEGARRLIRWREEFSTGKANFDSSHLVIFEQAKAKAAELKSNADHVVAVKHLHDLADRLLEIAAGYRARFPINSRP